MPSIADLLTRAVHLLALAVAPPFLSPAPTTGPASPAALVLAALLLAALLFSAGRLRTRLGGRDGLAAAVLVGAAIAAALVAADVFHGERGPLGRGVLYVAVPLWAGLAVVAAATASRWRATPGRARPRARVLAALATLAIGAGLFVASKAWLFSPREMWLAALRHDGDDGAAVEALVHAPLRARNYDGVMSLLDTCLASSPGACACLAGRAQVGIRVRAPDEAVAGARAAMERCPASTPARAALAEALATYGDAEQAEQIARAGLAQADDARLHYALALALDAESRRPEATDEARRALALGAGRDAALAVGKWAIEKGDFDAAAAALQPLVAADPDDADALFDFAIVADKRNDYNRAREGYLAALRADPRYRAARNNLVYLTLRQGAIDEARHHAQRFAAAFPDDPRSAVLLQVVAAATRPAAAP